MYGLEPENWDKSALSIVVVGASGDLAKKKIYPALFALYVEVSMCAVLYWPALLMKAMPAWAAFWPAWCGEGSASSWDRPCVAFYMELGRAAICIQPAAVWGAVCRQTLQPATAGIRCPSKLCLRNDQGRRSVASWVCCGSLRCGGEAWPWQQLSPSCLSIACGAAPQGCNPNSLVLTRGAAHPCQPGCRAPCQSSFQSTAMPAAR